MYLISYTSCNKYSMMTEINTNQFVQSDESNEAKMSEQKQEVYDEVQEVISQLGWSISNAKIAMEEALEQVEEETEAAIDKVVKLLEDMY